jgi:hypothetical protein
MSKLSLLDRLSNGENTLLATVSAVTFRTLRVSLALSNRNPVTIFVADESDFEALKGADHGSFAVTGVEEDATPISAGRHKVDFGYADRVLEKAGIRSKPQN